MQQTWRVHVINVLTFLTTSRRLVTIVFTTKLRNHNDWQLHDSNDICKATWECKLWALFSPPPLPPSLPPHINSWQDIGNESQAHIQSLSSCYAWGQMFLKMPQFKLSCYNTQIISNYPIESSSQEAAWSKQFRVILYTVCPATFGYIGSSCKACAPDT